MEKEIRNHRRNDDKDSSSEFFKRKTSANVLIGILAIFVGFVIIGNRTDFISDNLFRIIISWQALLIGLGIVNLSKSKHSFSGFVLIIIGTIFIIPKIIPIPGEYRYLVFPAVLIFIGILIVFRSLIYPKSDFHQKFHRNFEKSKFDFSEDYVDEKCVFGSVNVNVTSKQFKGGKIETVFGGTKINFLNSELSQDTENVLDVDIVFGGLELIVPRNWNVVIKTASILGGFEEKGFTPSNEIDSSKKIVIVGRTIFGGGEIKRY